MITKDEVLKLARLARLDFSDDELDKIIKDMEDRKSTRLNSSHLA